jgi:hypothetical protein
MKRRQCRAEAERTRCQQHVLHSRINRRPGRAGRGAPSRQGTIHTGASWMCAARYSAAASSRRNCSRLMPGAGSPDRYRGATCLSQARLYKASTVSFISASLTTRHRHYRMLPPLGAHTPASRIFRIKSFGTGSGFSRRIERVVLMISNRSAVLGAVSGIPH